MEAILRSHTVKFLRGEIINANIKGANIINYYRNKGVQINKDKLIELMLEKEPHFKHIKMSENKRSIGGMKGQKDGLSTELVVKNYLEKNKTNVLKFLKKKHNINCKDYICLLVDELRKNYQYTNSNLPENFKNRIEKYGKPKDNKRAADIVLIAQSKEGNMYQIKFDSKKISTSDSQLCCKSMNTFWNKYVDKSLLPSLQKYIDYNGKIRKFDKNHKDFEIIKNDLWKIMQNVKLNLIKKRDDNNELYFVDYIIQLNNNNELKMVKVDSILSLFNYEPEFKNTNFCFQKYITIKPHGSSRRNPQISLSCKIFNDNELSFCL